MSDNFDLISMGEIMLRLSPPINEILYEGLSYILCLHNKKNC